MCIMDVRAAQRTSTIAQAMAHNTKTIQSDMDMFRAVLIARGETDALAKVDKAQVALGMAYKNFLALFASEVARDVDAHHEDEPIGNENAHAHHEHEHVKPTDAEIVAETVSAVQAAERYETR